MSNGELAHTGVGAVVIGGLAFDSLWLVLGGFVVIGLGLLLVRLVGRNR
jgi:hypothetical protein